jgi:hypothetical protein
MRRVFATIALVLTAMLWGPMIAQAHLPTITYAKQRIVSTNVNGLCGRGVFWFCIKSHIVSRFRCNSADGHWRVFEVQYAEGKALDPWAARHCVVRRVSVSGNGVVGTPANPSYCYK